MQQHRPTPQNGFASVEDAVSALTPIQLQRLACIAGKRLDRLAAWPPGQWLRATFEPIVEQAR